MTRNEHDANIALATQADNASRWYKTAQARIACAKFPSGAYVSVRFSHRSESGVTWYEIGKTQFGTLDSPVMYPAHHLTNFVI